MTREEREKVEKHFDELHAIETGITISDDIKQAMKAAYMAGADYAVDMFATRWISVEDALPEEDGKYLFFSTRGGVQCAYYYKGLTMGSTITHWMPLPAHPISGNQSAVFTPISGNEKGGERWIV